MDKRKKVILIAILAAVLLVMILAAAVIYKIVAPNSEQKELSKQFELGKQEVALIVDNTVYPERGKVMEGEIYLPHSTAFYNLDKRLYLDEKDKVLSYATADGVICATANEKSYTIGKRKKEFKTPILKEEAGMFYVSLAFVKEQSACYIKEYKNPSRLVIMENREKTYPFAVTNDDVCVRVGPNKKYPYWVEVPEGTRVIINADVREENEYISITTPDGVKGYVPKDTIDKKKEEKWSFEKEVPSFEQMVLGDKEKICLGWHQVTNEASSMTLSTSVATSEGTLNVISPTWFALSDNKGNFTSFGNSSYVTQAHNAGIQVWGLINDFDSSLNLEKILCEKANRNRLVNSLVAKALQYQLDGINVDFERVTAESADGYLQFLRELTLKCHANELIVSVDNYTPAEYNIHYDLEEQGKIVDYVILMAYDEHYAGSEESGSVSSIGFVQNGTAAMLKKVPKDRVVVALPFYTRLWKEVKIDGGIQVSSEAYGMSNAESVLRANGASTVWDKSTGQYYAEYKSDGATYKIWLEEEKSLEEKLKAVKAQNVAGVAFWKLGLERPVTWSVIEEVIK